MTDLDSLYQELLLDHAKNPRHLGPLAGATHRKLVDNPVCGDSVEVFARVRDGRIEALSFEGGGCAISMASASMLTAALEGKTAGEARALWAAFQRLLRGEAVPAGEGDLGDLAAFAGVARFPVRVACARLAWEAIAGALGE